MDIQNNYVLETIDSESNTRVQVFTEYEEAYKTMEAEYKSTLTSLDVDDDEAEAYEESFIEKNCAQISNPYGDTIGWLLKKTFVQTPEMAAVCRQYDEMIAEAVKGASYLKMRNSSRFCCPSADAYVNACYRDDIGILHFTVCYMPFAEQNEFVPFETYKWCVERGIKKVSDMDEANRILAEIDATALFAAC